MRWMTFHSKVIHRVLQRGNWIQARAQFYSCATVMVENRDTRSFTLAS